MQYTIQPDRRMPIPEPLRGVGGVDSLRMHVPYYRTLANRTTVLLEPIPGSNPSLRHIARSMLRDAFIYARTRAYAHNVTHTLPAPARTHPRTYVTPRAPRV